MRLGVEVSDIELTSVSCKYTEPSRAFQVVSVRAFQVVRVNGRGVVALAFAGLALARQMAKKRIGKTGRDRCRCLRVYELPFFHFFFFAIVPG